MTGNTVLATNLTGIAGVFTSSVSGAAITGNTIQGTSGVFQNISGNTITGTTISAGLVQAISGAFTNIVFINTVISGDLRVLGSGYIVSGLEVSGQISGYTVTATGGNFTSLTGTTTTGTTANFVSGVFTTQVSGTLITGNTGNFSNTTGVSGTFTTRVSGATITGNSALFTTVTGSTLHITTPSGVTPAIVCSGIVSGSASGFVIKGPLIILP